MQVKKISEAGVGAGPRVLDEDAPKLMVTLVSARGLRNADWGTLGGLSDPYCTAEIPGKASSRITSHVIDNKLNPVWNYTAQVYDYEIGDSLSIAILDKDVGSADDLLGRTKVTRDIVLKGFEGELPLQDAGKNKKAFVTVKVHVEHPPPKPKPEEPTPPSSDASTATPLEAAAPAAAAASDSSMSPKVTPRSKLRGSSSRSPRMAAAGGAVASPRGTASASPQASEVEGPMGLDEKGKIMLDAAKKGDLSLARQMLEEGVPIDVTGAQGVTAMHLAVCCGHADLVSLFLRQEGKDKLLAAKTPEKKENALHSAARKDFKEISAMLVMAGISTSEKSKSGKTPADMAKGQLAEWLLHEDPASVPTPW